MSLISASGVVLMDDLVIPDHTVLDYNTRFSGVTEESMKAAKYTFKEARGKFLDFVQKDTIFVGHSLESDLKALRVGLL